MDEKTAWSNFINSGLVNDYLIYRRIHSKCIDKPQEEVLDANMYRWTDHNGKEYR